MIFCQTQPDNQWVLILNIFRFNYESKPTCYIMRGMKKFFLSFFLAFLCLSFITASAQIFETPYFQKREILTDYANTSGLIALWRFDENTLKNGSTVYDYFGKHNGVISSGPASGTMSITGKKFRGITFVTGSGNYYATVTNGNSDFVKNSTSTITVMFWFQRYQTFNNNCLLNFIYDASDDSWCLATGTTNNQLSFWDGTSNHFISIGSTVNTGTWYHVALVINGSTAQVYFNGAQIGSTLTGLSTTTRNNTQVWFSKDADSGGTYLELSYDEVSYWTRALSAAEISTIYNNQK